MDTIKNRYIQTVLIFKGKDDFNKFYNDWCIEDRISLNKVCPIDYNNYFHEWASKWGCPGIYKRNTSLFKSGYIAIFESSFDIPSIALKSWSEKNPEVGFALLSNNVKENEEGEHIYFCVDVLKIIFYKGGCKEETNYFFKTYEKVFAKVLKGKTKEVKLRDFYCSAIRDNVPSLFKKYDKECDEMTIKRLKILEASSFNNFRYIDEM